MKNQLLLSNKEQSAMNDSSRKTTYFKRSLLSILTFAYCGASFYAAASLNTPVEPIVGDEPVEQTINFSWAAIDGADGYRLEEENEAGEFVEVAKGVGVTQSLERGPGTYKYRLIACIDGDNNALVCNEEIANYSQITTVPVGDGPVPPAQIEQAPPLRTEVEAITDLDDISATIGVMAGEFRVDESGAANYSVPIALPEGIAGVTPELGVNYNSASGNGPLGIGWSISGLSSISRCRQTLEQDGQTRPLTLTNEDRFCLDGQRLIKINDEQDYGADTTEYRTEIDNKTRIISHGDEGGGPAYFVVTREDGSMSYYGNMSVNPDDDATDAIHTAGSGAVLTWYLSSISDNLKKNENTIYFDYNNGVSGFGENEITIDQIRYSDNTVKFNYVNNTGEDTIRRSGYLHGNKFELKALLDNVTVTNHDNILLKTYKFTYDQDVQSDIAHITEIQECGMGDLCYEPTVFKWNKLKRLTHTSRLPARSLGSDNVLSPLPIDLDGDGYGDFVFVSIDGHDRYSVNVMRNNGSGNLGPVNRLFGFINRDLNDYPIRLNPADIDGDGHLELVFHTQLANDEFVWQVYDDEARRVSNLIIDDGTSQSSLLVSNSSENISFNDINSDGYPDLQYVSFIGAGNSRESEVRISLNNREGSFEQYKAASMPADQTLGLVDVRVASIQPLQPVDINNDGVADSVFRMSSSSTDLITGLPFNAFTYYEAFSLEEDENGDYFYTSITEIEGTRQPTGYVYDGYHIQAGDINGDGLGDLLYQTEATESGNGTSYSYWLSKGDGTGSRHTLFMDDYDDTSSMQLFDINRDSRTDIIYFNTATKHWRVRYQNREGGFSLASNLLLVRDFNEDSSLVFPADWTGDGTLGFGRVNFNSRELFTWRDSISESVTANQVVISDITNGFGVSTNIDYELMTRPSIYKRGNFDDDMPYGNGAPVFDLISPTYLVSRVDSSAPGYVNNVYQDDNKLSVSYFYEGQRAQAGGRGLLGFEKVYTYDPQRNVTTETTYRQDFPFTGMPLSTLQYIGQRAATPASNKILSEATNSLLAFTFHGGKTHYPYIKTSIETMYGLNDAATLTQKKSVIETTNTYTKVGDNYLNMTGSVVVTKDASNIEKSSITTSNIFGADNVPNWWLGRITKTTVTHSRPNTTDIVRESEFTYDADGMLKTETVAPNGGARLKLVTTHCYDILGNKTASITDNAVVDSCARTAPDTTGSATDIFRYAGMTYDSDYRYEEKTYSSLSKPLSKVNSRNAFGQITGTTDINGVTINSGFDAFARAYAQSNSLGQATRTTRALAPSGAALGSPIISEPGVFLVEKTIASGAPTSYQYIDKVGRVVATATEGFALGSHIIQINRYDEFGNVLQQSNPHYEGDEVHFSITTYDTFNRPQTLTAADGVTITSTNYAADGLSTTTSVISSHGIDQTQTERMNVLGERTKITDANNSDTVYGYDATGNLVRVENEGIGATQSVITTAFDDYGRKTAMNDPDKGDWAYTYNALGEMTSQTDAKNQTMSYFRDSEGRTVKRTDHGGRKTFYEYNRASHPQLMTAECISTGTSCSTGTVEYAKNYFYDAFSRVDMVTTTLGDDIYMEKTTYDEYGRVFQRFDATGNDYGIRQHYNDRGYPTKQEEARYSGSIDSSLKKVYYEVTEMDAFGNVTEVHQNNGLIVRTGAYDPETGFATSMQATVGNVLIQDNVYTFDGIGNLRTRQRGALKSTASVQVNGQSQSIHNQAFGYDDLNRMTHINSTEHVRYMANGNISWKSDVGHYCYSASRPHAVTGIKTTANCTSTDYKYDNNGNMTRGRGRTITYSDFDKPTFISNSEGTTTFDYDSGRSRYKRTTTETNEATVMYYIGNVEVVLKGAAANDVSYSETRRYLPGAIQTQTTSGIKNQYLTKDHLGSIDTILDDNAKIIEKLYFDAWGKKVSLDKSFWSTAATNQAAPSLVNVLDITPRGYTGHEHVDHADIIHMNGRIYDPTLGRFLQADPHIQAPQNSQSYNRYSYVLNNPLSYTDPSGYFFNKLFKGLNKLLGDFAPFIGIALLAIPGVGAWAASGIWQAATVGFVTGGISTGSLRGALIGAFSGAAFQQIGSHFRNLGAQNVDSVVFEGAQLNDFVDFGGNLLTKTQVAGQIASHAAIGGVTSALGGGKFGHGFLSAGVTKGLGGAFLPGGGDVTNTGDIFKNTLISAAIGGTVSVISGGKFANGARTAAYQYSLNQLGQTIKDLASYFLPDPKAELDRGLAASKAASLERTAQTLSTISKDPSLKPFLRAIIEGNSGYTFANNKEFELAVQSLILDIRVKATLALYESISDGPTSIGLADVKIKGVRTIAHDAGTVLSASIPILGSAFDNHYSFNISCRRARCEISD